MSGGGVIIPVRRATAPEILMAVSEYLHVSFKKDDNIIIIEHHLLSLFKKYEECIKVLFCCVIDEYFCRN